MSLNEFDIIEITLLRNNDKNIILLKIVIGLAEVKLLFTFDELHRGFRNWTNKFKLQILNFFFSAEPATELESLVSKRYLHQFF